MAPSKSRHPARSPKRYASSTASSAGSIEHSFVSEKLRATVPHVRNVSVQRAQHRLFWTRFERFRGHLKLFNDDDANERYLFHGTGACAVAEVLAGRDGLDPRYSDGKGFYGAGTYLAENAAYPIGGRFAHRLTGHGGARMQLLLVRAAVGTPQELDVQVSAKTRAMRMPGERSDMPGEYYNSVRAGPHRPFCSGPDDGGDGDDASIVFVVYRSEQMCVRVSLASDDHMPAPSNHPHTHSSRHRSLSVCCFPLSAPSWRRYPAYVVTFDVPLPVEEGADDATAATAASEVGRRGDGSGQPASASAA